MVRELSKEAWSMLTRGGAPEYEKVMILIEGVFPELTRTAYVLETLTFGGVEFAPGSYIETQNGSASHG